MELNKNIQNQMRGSSSKVFKEAYEDPYSNMSGLERRLGRNVDLIERGNKLRLEEEERKRQAEERQRQRQRQVDEARERVRALSGFTNMPIDSDGIAKPLRSAEDDLYKDPLDDVFKRGRNFNERLILNLNTADEIYRKAGFSEKEIAEKFRPAQVDNVKKRQEIYNKLNVLTKDIKGGREGFFQGIKEESIKSTIENMLSEENKKAFLGEENNVDLIESFIESKPELMNENRDFLSRASRGFISSAMLQANNMNEALKDPKTLLAVIGAGVLAGGLVLATGGTALAAGGIFAGSASATLGASSLALGSTYSTYGMLGVGSMLGMSYGLNKAATYKLYERTVADTYTEGIREGLSPSIARANALGSGVINTLIEKAQLDTMGITKVPGISNAVDAIRKKSLKLTKNKLMQIGLTIGSTIVSESLEEATQAVVEDMGINLSKRMNYEDSTLIDALTKNPHNIALVDNFDVYADVFKESMVAMAFTPLIPVASQVRDMAIESKASDVAKTNASNDRYKNSIKSFIKDGGVKNFLKGVYDKNLSKAQKLEIANCALNAKNACDIVEKTNQSIFGEEDKQVIKDLKRESEKAYREVVKEYKQENPDFYVPDSTVMGNKRKLVEGLVNGELELYKNFVPLRPELNLQVANRYLEASNIKNVVPIIETGFNNGDSKTVIASDVADVLPRRIKKKYKNNPSGLAMEAMKYVNAVETINAESRLQAEKAKFTTLERMGYKANANTVDVEAKADNINREYDLKKESEQAENKKGDVKTESKPEEKPRINNDEETDDEIDYSNLKTDAEVWEEQQEEIRRKKIKEAIKVDPEKIKLLDNEVEAVKLKDIDLNLDYDYKSRRNLNIYSFANYYNDPKNYVTLYKDSNGKLSIIDGFARVMGAKNDNLDTVYAKVYDSADLNFKEAKLLSFMNNVEGSESSIGVRAFDIAKAVKDGVFSYDDFLNATGINPNSDLYKNAVALKNLNEIIYEGVILGQVDPELATTYAKLHPRSKTAQFALFDKVDTLLSKDQVVFPESVRWIDLLPRFNSELDNEDDYNRKLLAFNHLWGGLRNNEAITHLYANDNQESLKAMYGDQEYTDLDTIYYPVKRLIESKDEKFLELIDKYAGDDNKFYINRELADEIVNFLETKKIDALGYRPGEINKKEMKYIHQFDREKTNPITALFDDSYRGENIFKANNVTPKMVDRMAKLGDLPVLIADNADDNLVYDVMSSLFELKQSPYLGEAFIHFDGLKEEIDLTRKELDKLEYTGYEEGTYTVKGYTQEKNGTGAKKLTGIFLHNGAGKETVAEEALHYIIDKERQYKSSSLIKDIENWTKETVELGKKVGVDIPSGDELFAKSYLYNKFKLADKDGMGIFKISDKLIDEIDWLLGKRFVDSIFYENMDKDLLYNRLEFNKLDLMRDKIDNERDIIKAKNGVDPYGDNFKKWFGKSRVLDFKGDPLVVYTSDYTDDHIYYTDKALHRGREGYLRIVKPKYLALEDNKAPTKLNASELRSKGYDGIVYTKEGKPISYQLFDENKMRNQFLEAYKTGQVRYQLEGNDVNNLYNADEIKKDINSEGTGIRGMYENLERKGRGDVVEDAIKGDEENAKYKKVKNNEAYRVARAILEEDGIDATIDRLIAMPSFDAVDMATYSILTDNYSNHPKFAELTDALARRATEMGQAIQIMSTLGRGREVALTKLAENMFENSHTEAQKKDISSTTKKVKRNIININKEAVKDIDYNDVVEGVINNSDEDFAYNKIADLRQNEDFNEYVKEISNKSGVDETEILKGTDTGVESDNENAKQYSESIKEANNVKRSINSSNKGDIVDSVRKAIINHYIGEEDSSLYDSIIETGITNEEAKYIADRVIREINERTRAKKEKVFKDISQKGDLGHWEYVLDDLADSNVDFNNLKGEVAGAKGVGGVTKVMRDSIKEAANNKRAKRSDVIATEQVLQAINSNAPVTVGRKLSTAQAIFQLMNPKTMLRNIVGNAIFGTLDANTNNALSPMFDKMLSSVTGERTVTFRSPAKNIKSMLKGGKSGGEYSFAESKKGIRSDNYVFNYDNAEHFYKANKNDAEIVADRFGLPSQKTFSDAIFSRLENAMNITLSVPDKIFANASMQEAFDAYIEAQKKQGIEITPEVIQNAVNVGINKGLYRTFNDNTKLAQLMNNIKRGLNRITFGKDWGMGDMLLKYAKTPSNIIMRGIDYSPVGAFKAIAMFHEHRRNGTFNPVIQRQTADAIASSLTGTAVIGLGYMLASHGLLSPSYDEDDEKPKAKKLKSSLGEIASAINISGLKRLLYGNGDTRLYDEDDLMDISWAPPVAAMIQAGASVYNAMSDNSSGVIGSIKNVGNATLAGANTLVEQDVISNAINAFKYSESFGDAMAKIATSVPSSFVPSILGQVANFIDPTRRVTKDDNYLKTARNKLMSRLPGLKQTLEAKPDVYGFDDRWDTGKGSVKHFYDSFFSLGNNSKFREDPVGMELLDIYENTGDTSVIPSELKNSFGKTKNKLSDEDFAEIREYRAELIYNELYDALDYLPYEYEDRKKEIKKIYKNVDEQVKATVEELMGDEFYEGAMYNKEGDELDKDEFGNYIDDKGISYDENFKPIKKPSDKYDFGG